MIFRMKLWHITNHNIKFHIYYILLPNWIFFQENEEKQSFNMAQLEECDDTDEELKFYAIDVFTGKVETVVSLQMYSLTCEAVVILF